jgi:glycerate-2-kinase
MLGSQIITGKTLTNVNDLNVICRLTNGNSD